jgi:hypothetical protein
MFETMNAVELFEQLGYLDKVRWTSKYDGRVVRVDERQGELVHISVEMPFVGAWIPDKPVEILTFLGSYTPDRGR